MQAPARQQSITAPAGPQRLDQVRAVALLAALREAHEELGSALDLLDSITAGPEPEPAVYANARWRLSSARRKRRAVAAEIYAGLIEVAGPAEADALARLRADDDRRLRASALHVQHWCNDRIAADWASYCAAAADMRAAARDWIACERALLLPMLERFVRGAA